MLYRTVLVFRTFDGRTQWDQDIVEATNEADALERTKHAASRYVQDHLIGAEAKIVYEEEIV